MRPSYRREPMKTALSLGLAAVIAAGCGSDDKDDGERPAVQPNGNVVRFESPRIGFTFEYPKELTAEERPREGVLARVGIKRGSRLNAIKIRRTARRELGLERYLDEFRRDFERTVGKVDKRKERIGELDTGVLEFEDSVKRGGEVVELRSSSYFFAGGGDTWQLECFADSDHQQQIDDACRIALESVDFAR